jgi:plasmid stabilization system protein ParE
VSTGYVIRPRADRDLDEIADYFVQNASLDLGLRFLAEAHDTLSLLATQPGMGWSCRLQPPEFRSVRVFRVGEPFDRVLIFYRPASDRIDILRVLQGMQDLEARFGREGLDQ